MPTRMRKAQSRYLSLQDAYEVLKQRNISPALRAEFLDILSEAHREYVNERSRFLRAAAEGRIPERRTA